MGAKIKLCVEVRAVKSERSAAIQGRGRRPVLVSSGIHLEQRQGYSLGPLDCRASLAFDDGSSRR